jgi:hypothetical protein
MILLGAGGHALSQQHAIDFARIVSAINPRFVSTLVMTPTVNTPLYDADMRGEVDHLTPIELAAELRQFIENLDVDGCIFRSNHASNYLTLAGTLPKDQNDLLEVLDHVLADPQNAEFRPEWMRGL